MEKPPLLTKDDIASILAVSILFDLLQAGLDFVPGVGWALNVGVDIIAWITFFLMLRKRGIYLNSFRKIATFNLGLILDLFPFINIFAWTIDMLAIIAISRSESSGNSKLLK